MNIPIHLPDGRTLEGDHPLVVIGPNGSGKTRFGAALIQRNSAEMIGAVRNLEIQDSLPVQTVQDARNNLTNLKQNRRTQPWTMANEIHHLFSKLITEDASAAQKFRDEWKPENTVEPARTSLMRLRDLWSDVMPGRTLHFDSYSPKVESDLAGGQQYPARQMSDGERVALYLAGRVLDADKRIVVVDEPEVHFHARLAVRFWDALERERPGIRFVYISHDLAFARSRRSAQYILVKPSGQEVLDVAEHVPPDVAQALLSAASFSIHAQRIVFCEGTEGGTDSQFYESWFHDVDTAVIPVGTCKDVGDSTRSFGNSGLVEGVEAIGIVDRDYWPERQISALSRDVIVLPVHEVESLYCLEPVFRAIADHLAIPSNELDNKYSEFLGSVRAHFTGPALAKQVSERFKRRMEQTFFDTLNNLRMADDVAQVRTNHVSGVETAALAESPGDVFDEEQKRIQDALNDAGSMLEILPGKVLVNIAARVLGVNERRYMALVHEAMMPASTSESEAKNKRVATLSKAVIGALSGYLPARAYAPEAV